MKYLKFEKILMGPWFRMGLPGAAAAGLASSSSLLSSSELDSSATGKGFGEGSVTYCHKPIILKLPVSFLLLFSFPFFLMPANLGQPQALPLPPLLNCCPLLN